MSREDENTVSNNALIWLGLAHRMGPLLNALLLSFLLLPLVVY